MYFEHFCTILIISGFSIAQAVNITNTSVKIRIVEPQKSKCSTDNPERYEFNRYDEERKKCFLVGSQGPCGENMRFFDLDGINGMCDCNLEERILIFNPQMKKCYFIFDQGYCKTGEWLILDNGGQGKPICEQRKCEERKYPYKNSCVPIGAKVDCIGTRRIGFMKGILNPLCTNVVSKPAQAQCNPGSVLAISGKCEYIVKF